MGVLPLLMLPQISPKCQQHLKSHSSQRKRPVSNFSWSINVLVSNCEMMLVEILCCLHSFCLVFLTFFRRTILLLYISLLSAHAPSHAYTGSEHTDRYTLSVAPQCKISTISKLCENTLLCIWYTVIDSDVHMCIGRKKSTRVWSKNTSEHPTAFCILPICRNSPTNSYDVEIGLFFPLSISVVEPHKGSKNFNSTEQQGKKTIYKRWKTPFITIWLISWNGPFIVEHNCSHIFSYLCFICSDIYFTWSMLYIGHN